MKKYYIITTILVILGVAIGYLINQFLPLTIDPTFPTIEQNNLNQQNSPKLIDAGETRDATMGGKFFGGLENIAKKLELSDEKYSFPEIIAVDYKNHLIATENGYESWWYNIYDYQNDIEYSGGSCEENICKIFKGFIGNNKVLILSNYSNNYETGDDTVSKSVLTVEDLQGNIIKKLLTINNPYVIEGGYETDKMMRTPIMDLSRKTTKLYFPINVINSDSKKVESSYTLDLETLELKKE